MEADISIWRKTGHFYFALTRSTGAMDYHWIIPLPDRRIPTIGRRAVASSIRVTTGRSGCVMTGAPRSEKRNNTGSSMCHWEEGRRQDSPQC
jgi:hypothetical protein